MEAIARILRKKLRSVRVGGKGYFFAKNCCQEYRECGEGFFPVFSFQATRIKSRSFYPSPKTNHNYHTIMTSLTPSALIATAKSSGRVPPSLVSEDRIIDGGIFESTLSKCLDEGEISIFLWGLLCSPSVEER